MDEKWSRLENFIGKENLQKLKEKNILVVGLGGVGGYAVECFIRSGISQMTLIDFDVVEESNLNRQIIANQNTIGRKKPEVMKERCLSINQDASIRAIDLFLDEKNMNEIFDQKYDFVIDACDTVKTKEELIRFCLNQEIPIISSMGTARKRNPDALEIVEIKKTSVDPLARKIRQFMKKEFPTKKLYVLSSKEIPVKAKNNILSSMIFVPAVAGIKIAHFVIEQFLS